jgi:hypothetical protein
MRNFVYEQLRVNGRKRGPFSQGIYVLLEKQAETLRIAGPSVLAK